MLAVHLSSSAGGRRHWPIATHYRCSLKGGSATGPIGVTVSLPVLVEHQFKTAGLTAISVAEAGFRFDVPMRDRSVAGWTAPRHMTVHSYHSRCLFAQVASRHAGAARTRNQAIDARARSKPGASARGWRNAVDSEMTNQARAESSPSSAAAIARAPSSPDSRDLQMPCDDSGSNASAASPTASRRVCRGAALEHFAGSRHTLKRALDCQAGYPPTGVHRTVELLQPMGLECRLFQRQQVSVGHERDHHSAIGRPPGIPPAVPRRFDEGPIFLLLLKSVKHADDRCQPVAAHACCAQPPSQNARTSRGIHEEPGPQLARASIANIFNQPGT